MNKPMKDLLIEWQQKGVREIYGFNGRYGMVFLKIEDEIKEYKDSDIRGRVTPRGYVVEEDGYKLGQLVHPSFGWE